MTSLSSLPSSHTFSLQQIFQEDPSISSDEGLLISSVYREMSAQFAAALESRIDIYDKQTEGLEEKEKSKFKPFAATGCAIFGFNAKDKVDRVFGPIFAERKGDKAPFNGAMGTLGGGIEKTDAEGRDPLENALKRELREEAGGVVTQKVLNESTFLTMAPNLTFSQILKKEKVLKEKDFISVTFSMGVTQEGAEEIRAAFLDHIKSQENPEHIGFETVPLKPLLKAYAKTLASYNETARDLLGKEVSVPIFKVEELKSIYDGVTKIEQTDISVTNYTARSFIEHLGKMSEGYLEPDVLSALEEVEQQKKGQQTIVSEWSDFLKESEEKKA